MEVLTNYLSALAKLKSILPKSEDVNFEWEENKNKFTWE